MCATNLGVRLEPKGVGLSSEGHAGAGLFTLPSVWFGGYRAEEQKQVGRSSLRDAQGVVRRWLPEARGWWRCCTVV